jgi:two-component system sensor histidine kinase and response regulator WspE
MSGQDLSQLSMQDLFRLEAEGQTEVLTAGLLALEHDPHASDQLETCMRAAHSLKGAARIVDLDAGVALAHAMEDILVAAQENRIALAQEHIDLLLRGTDLMIALARTPDLKPGEPIGERRAEIDRFIADLTGIRDGAGGARSATPDTGVRRNEKTQAAAPSRQPAGPAPEAPQPAQSAPATSPDRGLRVSVENLTRLLALTGESLVESRWLKPFGESLLRLKRLQQESAKAIDKIRESLPAGTLDERAQTALLEAERCIDGCQRFLSERLVELEQSDRQATSLSHRLYDQALACRMRPFADGLAAFPRMVRDLGRSLGKQVRLEIVGAATQVDRDVLEMLEAPLGHLLRNAVDHGIEPVEERRAAGKPAEAIVRLEARHSAGALEIIVADDGRGIFIDRLREKVIARGLASVETTARLSEAELLEFLFLPGFSLKDDVSEISGRGVGLDVVQTMLKQVRGIGRIVSEPGRGTRFHLQLPLTLSVVRTLLAEVGGEPYAFPLVHLARAIVLAKDEIKLLEGRQYFDLDGEPVGLALAEQVLGGKAGGLGNTLSVLVIGGRGSRHGLVVDRFLGGRELVVRPLDPRLGKIKDISAAALLEDGAPVLIVDVEDLIRSMEKLAEADRLDKVEPTAGGEARQRKRVLVVDDSLTVRELERKLLDRQGYRVEVAVDGMDGWNMLRGSRFDLVITDIDMPRMDGIELVTTIRKDSVLRSLPVMVVSYKDREEDRRRGLEAGADYYLTKSSFQDDTLVQAVADLIGAAA